MIIAVGHDLIEIERIRQLFEREGKRAEKLFTPTELQYCARLANPIPSYAARYAAKEAFQKVWPKPHGWRDVWVERNPTPEGSFPYTRPKLQFSPDITTEIEVNNWVVHLTLTHTKENASAVVILEQK